MYDILTNAAVADELAHLVETGRVQKTGLRDRHSVVFEIYAQQRRVYLVVAISGSQPCCYLSNIPIPTDAELVTPFSLLLRKYVRGGVIVAIEQPKTDRIIRLSIAKLNDRDTEARVGEPDYVYTTISIEIMGRRSNVILVDDQQLIMEAMKRVTPDMSSVRPVLPRLPYTPPPQPDRLMTREATERQIEAALADSEAKETVYRVLLSAFSPLSPQMAREAVYLSTGNQNTRVRDFGQYADLASQLQSSVTPLDGDTWSPVLYQDEDGTVAAYAALPQAHLAADFVEQRVETVSAAIQEFNTSSGDRGRHEGRRKRLESLVTAELDRSKNLVRQLREQQRDLERSEQFRRWGEAILANLWHMEPGQALLEVDGEQIPLTEGIPAKDVAQEYFKQYRRTQRGKGNVGQLLARARAERAWNAEMLSHVQRAESFDDIERLRTEWEEAHPASSKSMKRRGSKSRHPEALTDSEGNQIYIGRSSAQNDEITFDIGNPGDWWLHARGVPGSHVLVKSGAGDVSEEALLQAASLAAWFSADRKGGSSEVDICRRKDVRKIRGARPGLVTYRNERTVAVVPSDELIRTSGRGTP